MGGESGEVVDAVILLTKTKDVPYEEYIKKIKESSIASDIKIADMEYNLSDKPSAKKKREIRKSYLLS